MRRSRVTGLAGLALVGLAWLAAEAASTIHVVATIPDLASLAEEVGGQRVEVTTLARGNQNAHEVEVRPSLMLKLRRADLLITNGLDLDRWVDLVVQGANNPRVVRGGPGVVDASRGIPVLEVPGGRVDRSMGDVHPLGNPHYTLDPTLVPIVTQNILEGLVRVAPEHRAAFERNRQQFLRRLEEAMAQWNRALERFRGAKVVVYHPQWIYFLQRFGLVEAGWVEERPGIPPSPGHLVRLVRQMRDEGIKVLIISTWNDQRLAARVAEDAGAKVVVLAQMVGAVKDADTYLATLDYNVKTLARALSEAR